MKKVLSNLTFFPDQTLTLDIETLVPVTDIRLAGTLGPDGYYWSSDPYLFKVHLESALKRVDYLITWNGAGFDIPVLNKLWGIDLLEMCNEQNVEHVDGMILHKLVYPDSRHSLDAVCETFLLGKKSDLSDFNTAPIAELTSYNKQDLELTEKAVGAILQRAKKQVPSIDSYSHALAIEQAVASQQYYVSSYHPGFKFDTKKAKGLWQEWTQRLDYLERLIPEYFEEVPIPNSRRKSPPKIQFLANGEPSAFLKKYLTSQGAALSFKKGEGPSGYSVVTDKGVRLSLPLTEPIKTHEPMSVRNTGPLKDALLEMGWKPRHWNIKKDPVTGKKVQTSPRLTDPVTKEPCQGLLDLGVKAEVVEHISEWLGLRARRNLISGEQGYGETGWSASAISNFGYINSGADTLGTPTARYRHNGIVNVPRVTSFKGEELRSLFGVGENKVQVGWDASALEACCEAHYTYVFDKGAYAGEILKGDIHTKNQKEVGLLSRDDAKRFKYAATYGAKPPKLASDFNVSRARAEKWYGDFWEANPALTQLKRAVEAQWRANGKKYIIGLDGRPVHVRYEHALLNTLFQSAGAIVMKHAGIIAERRIRKGFTNAYPLIRYHDEEQWSCYLEDADEIGVIGVDSITDAGKYLKMRVALTGEYKVGKNWAECH